MVDYSKWNHIEVSDDEDEVHPNIDTPSLFRWRHKARMERMEEAQQKRDVVDKEMAEAKLKVEETRKKLEQLKTEGDTEKTKAIETRLKELEKDEQRWRKKEEELSKEEKKTPWNVDTLSKDGFEKTVINKYTEKPNSEMTDEELEKKQVNFVKKNEKIVKKFGMFKKFDDSQNFLLENLNLVCEETSNYLVIWCVNLACEEKFALMEQVAHQCIVMQYLLELAKSLKQDPRACVRPFFTKIKKADPEYMRAFDDELDSFKERVRNRAKIRYEKALKEAEEELEQERQARLGPGGLDPAEVFESLPKEMQECFESQNIAKLQDTIAAMKEEDAAYYMKRCVESGLWVPDAKKAEKEAAEKKAAAEAAEAGQGDNKEEEESPYAEVEKKGDGTSV